jgi:hypothetical protein
VFTHAVAGTVGVRDVGGKHGGLSPGAVFSGESAGINLVLEADTRLDLSQERVFPVLSLCSSTASQTKKSPG